MSGTHHEYRKKYRIIRPSVVNEIAHGVTVSNLACLVAKELGLSQEDCHDLAAVSYTHLDVYKRQVERQRSRCFWSWEIPD